MITNQQLLAIANILDAQFTILNIEGLQSSYSIYYEWTEDQEERECPECHGWGTHICDCGHEHECQECDGRGTIEITGNQREECQTEFNSNIII